MDKTLLFTIDFPPNIGGVANYYFEIYKHLPQDKIFVLTQKTDKRTNGNSNIYRDGLISYLPIWPKWLPAILALYKTVKKEKIKTVLVGQVLPLGTITFILSRILNIEYIVSTHGLDILESQKTKRKKLLTKIILKNSKKIITNSNFTKKEIEKIGVNDNKIKMLYPCPHIKPPAKDKVKKELEEKYSLKNKKIILSVGRIVERKGFDMTIRSMKSVKGAVDNAIYVIAGSDSGYEKKIKKLIKDSNCGSDIVIINNPTNDELAALYDLCSLFIMPSRKIGSDVEGFGIVFLEANSFNKPVIGGKSGGVSDAIIDNKTGLLVDPLNIDEISGAIIRLIKDPEMRDCLGRNGKNRVDNEFTWNSQVKKLQDFL